MHPGAPSTAEKCHHQIPKYGEPKEKLFSIPSYVPLKLIPHFYIISIKNYYYRIYFPKVSIKFRTALQNCVEI